MTVSALDVVRVNATTWSWQSCIFKVDGQGTEGVVAIDYEDKLDTRTVYSNQQDGGPLGMSQGRYQIASFPLAMLRDSALALKNYLATKATASASGSYGQAVFTLTLQLAELDSANGVPTTVVFSSCRIVGEKASHEEGTDAAITEYQVACLLILQDGNTLWNALPPLLGGFPAVDTITVCSVPAPGKWTLQKGPRVFGWDIRKGYGLSGATVVPSGDDLVVAEFLVELWDPSDYALFGAFRSQFLKKALVSIPGGVAAMALGIDHPELKALGAVSFVVKEVNPLMNDGYGVWSCSVVFLEYRKPLPALSKPPAALPDVAPPKPTAQDADEREAQALAANFQALAGAP